MSDSTDSTKDPAAQALGKRRWSGVPDAERRAHMDRLRALARKKMTAAQRKARAQKASAAAAVARKAAAAARKSENSEKT